MVQFGPVSRESDGYEDSGTNWTGGPAALYVGDDYHIAWRWTNVTVEQGATIDTPTQVVVNIEGVFGSTVGASTFANADDNAPALGSSNRPSQWTRTTASTAWPNEPPTGSATIDVQAIVQEIVDRSGWTSGNAMAFTLYNLTSSAAAYHQIEGLAAAGTAEATLEINYVDEEIDPDAIISSTVLNVSGGIGYIQDDPFNPDANWFTNAGTDGTLRVSFGTPAGTPTTGAGLQQFRVRLRKQNTGGGTPTFSAELRETGGGSALQTLATNQALADLASPGEVFTLTWDAANLGTADGSAVELLLTFTSNGGGPNARHVEVGAIEWGAMTDAAAPAVISTLVMPPMIPT